MKSLKIYSLLILIMGSLISCEKERGGAIWDISPVEISFIVQDRAGNDLLNPAAKDNITENDIKVIYAGKEYSRDVDMSGTRAYLAVLNGLRTDKYGNDYYLTFGEFDGATDHYKSFTIDWGDGTTDEITFIHEFAWGDDGSPEIRQTDVYLNNKKVEGIFTILK